MVSEEVFLAMSVYYMHAKPKDLTYLRSIYAKLNVVDSLDTLNPGTNYIKEEHLHEFFLRYTPMEMFYMLAAGHYELFYNSKDSNYYLFWR